MTESYHMRRADRQITDRDHIERIIGRGRYIMLALIDGVEPYAVTLSYGYDAGASRLYFHTAHDGHKLDVISLNPRTCGTIVLDGGYTQGECEHPYESAVVRGTLRVVESAEEKERAIHVLVDHLEQSPDAYWSSRSWALDERLGGFSALCLDIESITAKRGS